MIGREVAAFAGRHFEEQLKLNASYKLGNYEQALIDNFLKIDDLLDTAKGRIEISKISLEDEKGSSTNGSTLPGKETPAEMMDQYLFDMKGCTANVMLVKNDHIYIANAGDSRAVMGKKGRAIPLSIDHKPDNETEKERIFRAGGQVIDGRVEGNLNLSRALGDLKYKKDKTLKPHEQLISAYPEVKKFKVTPDLDFVVMGCDGIWEEKTCQDVCDFIYAELDKNPEQKLSKICEKLLDSLVSPDYIATGGIGCDNMTIQIIKFKK
jgi:serine/threonine protein phosphatase PrpC